MEPRPGSETHRVESLQGREVTGNTSINLVNKNICRAETSLLNVGIVTRGEVSLLEVPYSEHSSYGGQL